LLGSISKKSKLQIEIIRAEWLIFLLKFNE
jgi:hypothetical protein